ncbi:MAG TPA: ABC transporter ATP-binding protein [Nitrospirae bacterium]|nr:ABC transporter ATP-binding protein [Nitrospirota bacterium]
MPIIKTIGLKKSFSTPAGDLAVLKGIDLEIWEGEMVAIVGASGVGKSTLLHVLGTLDRPTEGTVLYGGEDVFTFDDLKLASFRNERIGFVFQFHHLLPEFTAIENVMMPGLINGLDHSVIEEKAAAILGELGLRDRFHHRPGELSGGEQQRVAVARALVMEPQVVLADEPTGNLDTKTGNDLFDLLSGINSSRGTAFVIVTHNDTLAGRCTRIISMVDGMIADSRP